MNEWLSEWMNDSIQEQSHLAFVKTNWGALNKKITTLKNYLQSIITD